MVIPFSRLFSRLCMWVADCQDWCDRENDFHDRYVVNADKLLLFLETFVKRNGNLAENRHAGEAVSMHSIKGWVSAMVDLWRVIITHFNSLSFWCFLSAC